MRVLVACEFSGTVRDAFLARGHEAWSCDLLPGEAGEPHHQGDVIDLLDGWQPVTFQAQCDPEGDGWCSLRNVDPADCQCIGPTQDGIEYMERNGVLFGRPEQAPHWDLMVAHPPCTYLCSSGLHWNCRTPGRSELTEQALEFVRLLLDANVKRIALENPRGRIGTAIRKADQTIHPHQFGHDASKATCLWLKNLPPLQPTKLIAPRMVSGKPRWANQTDSGQNRLGPSPTRSADRARTYQGIADAMAEQWGRL